jgi:hypothetical protein
VAAAKDAHVARAGGRAKIHHPLPQRDRVWRSEHATNDEEKRHALNCLLEKYSPDYISEGQVEIANDWERLCVVEIRVEL